MEMAAWTVVGMALRLSLSSRAESCDCFVVSAVGEAENLGTGAIHVPSEHPVCWPL